MIVPVHEARRPGGVWLNKLYRPVKPQRWQQLQAHPAHLRAALNIWALSAQRSGAAFEVSSDGASSCSQLLSRGLLLGRGGWKCERESEQCENRWLHCVWSVTVWLWWDPVGVQVLVFHGFFHYLWCGTDESLHILKVHWTVGWIWLKRTCQQRWLVFGRAAFRTSRPRRLEMLAWLYRQPVFSWLYLFQGPKWPPP